MKDIETLCVQAGYEPESGDPRIPPIVQSTTFYYEKAKDLADLFDLKTAGHFYTRLSNPTVEALEKKVAALEGGTLAVGTASGMSATLLAVLNVCFAGDNIVCSNAIYGGTYNLFDYTLRKYGIETRFFNPDAKPEEIEKLIDSKTKLIFGETVSNPSIIVLDFDKISALAKKHGILFFVDNTLATPVFIRPKEWGVNIVLHSTSKYIDGHAAALGGMVVECGNFDFKDNPRYPEFNRPDESYHGLVYADLKGTAFAIKLRVQLIRDTGAIMAPQNAFITSLGCDTLALRMKKHFENSVKIAEFLKKSDMVEWISYPALKGDKYYNLAKKYLPNGLGGMMAFGVKGGAEAAARFMENLKLIAIVTHVADARSCVLHPASTTHRQLSAEALSLAGIPENLIRLSVGIENADDLLEDIAGALKSI